MTRDGICIAELPKTRTFSSTGALNHGFYSTVAHIPTWLAESETQNTSFCYCLPHWVISTLYTTDVSSPGGLSSVKWIGTRVQGSDELSHKVIFLYKVLIPLTLRIHLLVINLSISRTTVRVARFSNSLEAGNQLSSAIHPGGNGRAYGSANIGVRMLLRILYKLNCGAS